MGNVGMGTWIGHRPPVSGKLGKKKGQTNGSMYAVQVSVWDLGGLGHEDMQYTRQDERGRQHKTGRQDRTTAYLISGQDKITMDGYLLAHLPTRLCIRYSSIRLQMVAIRVESEGTTRPLEPG